MTRSLLCATVSPSIKKKVIDPFLWHFETNCWKICVNQTPLALAFIFLLPFISPVVASKAVNPCCSTQESEHKVGDTPDSNDSVLLST